MGERDDAAFDDDWFVPPNKVSQEFAELGDGWTVPDGASQEFIPPARGELIRFEYRDGRPGFNAIITSVRPNGFYGWTFEMLTDAGMDDDPPTEGPEP